MLCEPDAEMVRKAVAEDVQHLEEPLFSFTESYPGASCVGQRDRGPRSRRQELKPPQEYSLSIKMLLSPQNMIFVK